MRCRREEEASARAASGRKTKGERAALPTRSGSGQRQLKPHRFRRNSSLGVCLRRSARFCTMAAKPPPGPPTVAAASSPPPAPKPRVPLELADAPTQRLYLFAAFLLLQALKVADLVAPAAPNGAGTSSAPTSLLLDLLNSSRLLKWIAIDLFAIQVVSWLRVPRFDWGWKALWLGRIAMVLLNWLCFGSWTVRRLSFSFELGSCCDVGGGKQERSDAVQRGGAGVENY